MRVALWYGRGRIGREVDLRRMRYGTKASR